MNKGLLPSLLVLALVSTGETTLKIYPVIFCIFSAIYIASSLTPKSELAIPALVFTVIAITFTLINLDKSFDQTSFVKLLINTTFFVLSGSYILAIDKKESAHILRWAAIIFIALSFIQLLSIIYTNSLWLMPFTLEDSSASYVIQESTIIFGDQNKNIWASKVSIFFIILCCTQYADRNDGLIIKAAILISFFCLVYISSRTAQLATLLFISALFFYHFWAVKRKRIFLTVISIASIPAMTYLLQKVVRLDLDILFNFIPNQGSDMGDGLLARFIIWGYIVDSTELTSYLFGNGILSFSYYTRDIFPENNPHNAFLSILLDFGAMALLSYIYLLYTVFSKNILTRILIIPFLIFTSSQYVGYDSDLIVLFLTSVYLWKFSDLKTKEATQAIAC